MDPFRLFRTTLFVALGAYTVLTTVASVWKLVALLRGRDQHKQLLRVYVAYQILSFRVGPLAGELTQIGLLAGVLGVLWWLHRVLA